MNCAVHPDRAAAAYCRTCGKPLCEGCERTVRGVVYCEDCIATRIADTVPAQVVAPGQLSQGIPASGPNPALAVILAFFFPFGVGAVYTGQYAKGLAHMLIFAGTIWMLSTGMVSGAEPFFGIFLGAFYFYQIVDAYRSAKALQMGQAPPDPFGLGRALGGGQRVDTSKVPIGAIVLIGLGVLFLLNNLDVFHIHWVGKLWPLILIVIGVWLFVKRFGGAIRGGQEGTHEPL